jgi:hypothetical protein
LPDLFCYSRPAVPVWDFEVLFVPLGSYLLSIFQSAQLILLFGSSACRSLAQDISVSCLHISVSCLHISVFCLHSSVSTSGISDRSFGILFLRTGAPMEVFRIDHLVFCFCEQAHRRRYFGSIVWYFGFPAPFRYFASPLPISGFSLRLDISVLLYLFWFSRSV